MTMLTHSHSLFERVPDSTSKQNTGKARSTAARRAAINQLCMSALVVLAAFGALTAVIALKAAIYYWRFH
jgi:hypothetical protein